jgi:hypothetical protein
MYKPFVCDCYKGEGKKKGDCGPIDFVIIDGYDIGDRVLEGVMFKVWCENEEVKIAPVDKVKGEYKEISWEEDNYLCTLNKECWMKSAIRYAKRLDIAYCPKCGIDVLVIDVNDDESWRE